MQTLAKNNSVEQDLIDLASHFLPEQIQCSANLTIHPLAGDAGFRRYFRLSTQPTVLGVYATPESADWVEFMRVCRLMQSLRVRVPRIYAADLQQGILVIEDHGDDLYQNLLLNKDSEADSERLYSKALGVLHKLYLCAERPAWLPRYSDSLLRQEMELFPAWFVQQLLGYTLDSSESELITSSFDYLVAQALVQPQVLVHRDFHCRNLIDIGEEGPAVIDFQDAVWGPVTYDLISLSRDCYVRWNRSRVVAIRDQFARQLHQDKVIDDAALEQFPGWFESMSAQRHLKVLGIFSRLALRDHKTGYLKNLPLVLRYLLETCENQPALQNLADWIKTALLPKIENQDWYRDWHRAGDDTTVW